MYICDVSRVCSGIAKDRPGQVFEYMLTVAIVINYGSYVTMSIYCRVPA